MAMTPTELLEVARRWVRDNYVSPNKTATHNLDDIVAAIGAIDTAMNATGDQIVSAGYGSTALEMALLTECKNAAPDLDNLAAGAALALWALKRVGLL